MSFKFKDVLVLALLAFITTWTFSYLFVSKKTLSQEEETRPGMAFIAPSKPLDMRPINGEIDFIDSHRVHRIEPEEEVIETDGARFTFTNQGATLERLEFKKEIRGKPGILTTIYPGVGSRFENRCFLLALEDKTPFNYVKTDRIDSADQVVLTYRTAIDGGSILKTFTIYKKIFKITLNIAIALDAAQEYRMRVFYPAPVLPDVQDDVVTGLVLNDRDVLEITPYNKIDMQRGWFSPALFGLQDKYFIHALVADPAHFTQRAFYVSHQSLLYAVLEGPLHNTNTTWSLSFYCGPKESHALELVDSRLEQALEHAGWFAPISRGFLIILMWLFSYLGNYGLAIIVLTLLVRVLLWPLTIKGTKTMKNSKVADLQKKLKYIELKYKDDPERLAIERAEIMKAQGSVMVSMVSTGCLPLLLQAPVMYALSRALTNSIALYGASFLWIPDLSAKDPYMILPIIVTVSFLVNSFYVDKQQRTTMVIAGLVLGALAVNWSAGVLLYVASYALFSLVQAVVQQKMNLV